jgi:hypothetical protein
MRIELPAITWVDAAQRGEEDVHTLTLAAQPAPGRVNGPLPADPAPTLRAEVARGEPVVLTLTL